MILPQELEKGHVHARIVVAKAQRESLANRLSVQFQQQQQDGSNVALFAGFAFVPG